jgi:hypothetical protein
VNPTLPARVVERAYERDPMAARAEYDAEFRTDVAAFLDLAVVEAAVDHGVTVRPPVRGVRYRSGCDPSGGARDSFTLAIAHDEDGVAILDCLFEIKPPFNPTAAIADMAGTLKAYGLTRTVGDKYAAEWVVDAFAKAGIKYQHSDRDRSAIYLDACQSSLPAASASSTIRASSPSSPRSNGEPRRSARTALTMVPADMTTSATLPRSPLSPREEHR